MGFLSCLAIGLAFLVAVGLLVLAGVLLGWCIPAAVDRARGRGPMPPEVGSGAEDAGPSRPPPAPGKTDSSREA